MSEQKRSKFEFYIRQAITFTPINESVSIDTLVDTYNTALGVPSDELRTGFEQAARQMAKNREKQIIKGKYNEPPKNYVYIFKDGRVALRLRDFRDDFLDLVKKYL